MAKAKLTQQEKAEIKAENKAWRDEMIRRAREHQEKPAPPWTYSEKATMVVAVIIAIVVAIGLLLVLK